MSDLEKQLKLVHEKIGVLVKQYQALQKENGKLKQELAEIKLSNDNHTLELDRLHQRAQILQTSQPGMNEEEKKAFEKRLTNYVKEIDRCIALLNE